MAGNANSFAQIQLKRDSTNIYLGTGGSTSNSTSAINTFSLANTLLVPAGVMFLDSPATTSATTYSIDIKASNGTVHVNRFGDNANSGLPSSISVIEVAV
jgi:hypothetical protein